MAQISQQQARRTAYRIVGLQFAIAGIVGILFLILVGAQAGVSALVGGAISAAATYYQVRVAFSPRVSGDPRRIARAFYTAEVVKIAAMVALLTLALKWLNLAMVPTLIGFIATLFVYFAALLWPPLSGTNDG